MMKALKWIGYVLCGLLVIVLAAVGFAYAKTSSRLNHAYPVTADAIQIPTDSAAIERGHHLVLAVGKCTDCHGDNLAGKMISDDAAFGTLWSANLTKGNGGVGKNFKDADYLRAIRYGVHPDGKPLIFMPSEAYTNFSDADLGAIIAYVKSVPPVDQVIPAPRMGPVARIIATLTPTFPLAPAEFIDRNMTRPASVTPSVTKEYGDYLLKTGGCKTCHTENLSGGVKIQGVVSANLTPAGIGKWTEADFTKALRTGVRPDGRILSAAMPWPYMKYLTDDEIHSMWLYLRSIPARQQGG